MGADTTTNKAQINLCIMNNKPKLFLILILFLLFGKRVLAQVNIVFNDTLINQIDSNGVKNGLWIDFANPQRLHISAIKSRGYYKDNKKVGIWYYYYYNTHYDGLSEIVEYHPDNSITIIGRDKIFINRDSSEIHYYREQNREVTCLKTKDGNYNCTRKYIDIKKQESIIFKSFDECMDNLDTRWAVPTVSNSKKKSNTQRENFALFFESFLTDSNFQKARILYPLVSETQDKDAKEEDSYITALLNNYRVSFNKQEFSFEAKEEAKNNMVIVLKGKQTGLLIAHYFSLRNNQWYLEKIRDLSK